jgi:hypothetical protein
MNPITRRNFLLEQYQRCIEDWRYYDRLLWQIPFSTATVTATILALIYVWIQEIVTKICLIIGLLVFVAVMLILASKIRFFQEGRSEFARQLEEKITIEKIPIETKETLEFLKSRGIRKT